jgi:FkbM family methyltransferase
MTVSPFRWKLMVLRSLFVSTARIAVRAPLSYRNWVYFLWSRFSNKEGILVLRNGLRFWIRPHATDRAAITEVVVLGCYSPVPEGSVVLDVGANVGAFSLAASRRAAVVYALEPVGANYEMLRRNIELNKATNIVAERLAMSGENGVCEISVAGVFSSVHFRVANATVEQVPSVTLERFLEERGISQVDYLKMDCEGAEWDIVLNAPPSVLARIKHIEMEFHNVGAETNPGMLQERLSLAGFRSTVSGGDRFNGALVATRQAGLAHP